MATLRHLRGKYYARIRYKKQGSRSEKLIPLNTSHEANARKLMKQINKQEVQFKKGIIGINQIEVREPTDLEEYMEEFIEFKRINGISESTISLYRLAFDTLKEIYANTDLQSLTKSDYTDFIKQMRGYYPCKTTLNIRLRSIRSFFNWLADNDKIRQVPFDIRQLPTPKKKPRYFSDSEMRQILDAIDDQQVYARVYLHWKTGLRLSELHNSYLENGFVKTYNPIKHGAERSVPIDDKTAEYYQFAEDCDQYRDDTISKKFKAVLVDLELYKTRHGDRRTFHCLRHTFAVRKYYETRDIYRVKVLLGHSSVTTTEKYANFSIAELDQDFDLESDIDTDYFEKYNKDNSGNLK